MPADEKLSRIDSLPRSVNPDAIQISILPLPQILPHHQEVLSIPGCRAIGLGIGPYGDLLLGTKDISF